MATPREAGFHMPAEWDPHAFCWMAWPCRPENWDGIEAVTMTANVGDAGAARRALAGIPDIDVVVVPSDDSWARDTAPTFVVDGRGGLAGVDWGFNAYGGNYEEYGRTRNMARRILDLLGARRFAAPLVLEGGAIHVDGQGTVLTTPEVVLDPRRNPDLTRADAERPLCDYLGAEKVLWLSSTGPRQYRRPRGQPRLLRRSGRRRGARLRRPRRPAARGRPREPRAFSRSHRRPRPRTRGGGVADAGADRIPRPPALARHLNFYIANGAVIMPAFGDPADDNARDLIARLFPGRPVVPVPTLELTKADGNIHCVTQQQPVV